MSKFFAPKNNLGLLVDNSYRAIGDGSYNAENYDHTNHQALDMKKAIVSCSHAPLITEIKFQSPSKGKLTGNTEATPSELAYTMVMAGAIGLSVLTQPYLFSGSIMHLAMIRKVVNVPILMKDITVSEVQIEAAKRIGADCVLLIKTVFDEDLAEGSIEKFADYAQRKGLQVIVEVHSEQEFKEALELKLQKHNLIGINNRDLKNLEVNIATTEKLLAKHNKGENIVISESGISKQEEIQHLKRAGADSFLVGTSIMESKDISSKVNELYLSLS